MFLLLVLLVEVIKTSASLSVQGNVTTLTVLFLRPPNMDVNESHFVIEQAERELRKQRKLDNSLLFKIIERVDCDENLEMYRLQPVLAIAQTFYTEGVDVIIGPTCMEGMILTAQFAEQLNVPIIGYLSEESRFGNKEIYKTLSRVSISTTSLAGATATLLKRFGWLRVGALINSSNEHGMHIYNDIRRMLKHFAIEIRVEIDMADLDEKSKGSTKEYKAFRKLQDNARIIIIQMGYTASDAFWIMEELYKSEMNNEYFFIIPSGEMSSVNVQAISLKTQKVLEKSFIIIAEGLDPNTQHDFQHHLEKVGMSLNANVNQQERISYGYIHDAFSLYMLVSNQLFVAQHSQLIVDGLEFWKRTQNVHFQGATSEVWLGKQADRLPNYVGLTLKNGKLETCIKIQVVRKCLDDHCPENEQPHVIWQNPALPPDLPRCGYAGELCDFSHFYICFFILVILLLASVIAYHAYKKKKEHRLFRMKWSVPKHAINQEFSVQSVKSNISNKMTRKLSYIISSSVKKTIYQQKKTISWTKKMLNTLNQIKSLNHENLGDFVGISFNERADFAIIWKNYQRGSLEDIIFNEDVLLDEAFRFSFVHNIIEFHGHLDAATCLIDKHWMVKLSDFGLRPILAEIINRNELESIPLEMRSLLHTAPELLKSENNSAVGTKETDVYSLGIILYQLFIGKEPFDHKNNPDLLNQIIIGTVFPILPENHGLNDELTTYMKRCLAFDPNLRAQLKNLKFFINQLNPSSNNLVDHMMKMMGKYAGNLEGLVNERTVLLEEAQVKADKLLFQMLPKSVAVLLKSGHSVEPEMFESATVFFSDIVKFTQLCSQSTPMEIVNFLNSLYRKFDEVIDEHDAFKVETIGDAYLVVSGLPQRNGTLHVFHICHMALAMCDIVKDFTIPHIPEMTLEIRCGSHSGPLAAGVIGLSAPRYCLFGDTVNTASRMESTSLPQKIQISEDTAALVSEYSEEFITIERGFMSVKGKGEMRTYWLDRANNVSPSQGVCVLPRRGKRKKKNNEQK